jgi:hypothetical protein
MPNSATAGGFLLVLAIVLPVAGVLLSVALGGRQAECIALIMMPAGLAVAVAIAAGVWRSHSVLQYFVGGWDPPLGIAFRADGLSSVMIVTAALLICGIGLFARIQFPTPRGAETRTSLGSTSCPACRSMRRRRCWAPWALRQSSSAALWRFARRG